MDNSLNRLYASDISVKAQPKKNRYRVKLKPPKMNLTSDRLRVQPNHAMKELEIQVDDAAVLIIRMLNTRPCGVRVEVIGEAFDLDGATADYDSDDGYLRVYLPV